jgi:CheY-like chemotaxis protein
MPGVGGLDLLKQMRATMRHRDEMKVVMLNPIGTTAAIAEFGPLNISAWLKKPVRHLELSRCVADALELTLDLPDAGGSALQIAELRFDARVLLVEDHQVNQVVARTILERLSCHVTMAANGLEALDAMKQRRFDLVLMDCQMPEMDGYTATAILREREAQLAVPRTPVIALTANALQGDRERCLAAGMDDYLSKPFRREALSAVLARWLPGCLIGNAPSAAPIIEPRPDAARTAIDSAALDAIRSLGGETTPDLLEQIIRLYLEAAPGLMGAIKDGLAAANNDQVRIAAHTLKSSSANLGASRLAELCKKMELAARTNTIKTDAPALHEVQTEYERVCSALQQEVGIAA